MVADDPVLVKYINQLIDTTQQLKNKNKNKEFQIAYKKQPVVELHYTKSPPRAPSQKLPH